MQNVFPDYKGCITVFAYDWMGRIFAIDNDDDTIVLFDIGFGEDLEIPDDLNYFHEVEISESPQDCLSSDYFEEWFESNNHYVLKSNECVGYKVPVFLDGEDDLDNMEVSNMEVYWGIMGDLINS